MKSLKSIIKEHQRKATTEIQKLIVAELNKLKYQPKLYPLIYHRYSEYFSFYVGIIVDGKKYKVEYNGDDNIHFHVKDQIQYVTLGKFKTQIPQQIQKYHDDMEEAKRQAQKLQDDAVLVKKKYKLSPQLKQRFEATNKKLYCDDIKRFLSGKDDVSELARFYQRVQEAQPETSKDMRDQERILKLLSAIVDYLFKSRQLTRSQYDYLTTF